MCLAVRQEKYFLTKVSVSFLGDTEPGYPVDGVVNGMCLHVSSSVSDFLCLTVFSALLPHLQARLTTSFVESLAAEKSSQLHQDKEAAKMVSVRSVDYLLWNENKPTQR